MDGNQIYDEAKSGNVIHYQHQNSGMNLIFNVEKKLFIFEQEFMSQSIKRVGSLTIDDDIKVSGKPEWVKNNEDQWRQEELSSISFHLIQAIEFGGIVLIKQN